MNSTGLLTELQSFLRRRGTDVETLSLNDMVVTMLDWHRLVRLDALSGPPKADVLIFRYGGWSEGCATGFKLSVVRKVTEEAAGGAETDWYAGITLLFEPARYADLSGFATVSADWPSTEAFLHAIESSPAYQRSANVTPMSVVVESGGLR
ncbi:MAG: hypothetical protein JNL33_07215 [Betaproteobacteria bacterium]|nr:hypothetical protein [Betaproteobacteria bacterium]